ncbi:unnamed protein product [marine sediment metagenome]|uniref:Uncharacterized protein n=1 Tax=marine sediment metagenome TaxID=412755 RepID=X1S9S8_9ZZZZ
MADGADVFWGRLNVNHSADAPAVVVARIFVAEKMADEWQSLGRTAIGGIPLEEIAHGATSTILKAVDEFGALFKRDVMRFEVGIPAVDGNDPTKDLNYSFFPQSAQ